jgi:hypothetical protein
MGDPDGVLCGPMLLNTWVYTHYFGSLWKDMFKFSFWGVLVFFYLYMDVLNSGWIGLAYVTTLISHSRMQFEIVFSLYKNISCWNFGMQYVHYVENKIQFSKCENLWPKTTQYKLSSPFLMFLMITHIFAKKRKPCYCTFSIYTKTLPSHTLHPILLFCIPS